MSLLDFEHGDFEHEEDLIYDLTLNAERAAEDANCTVLYPEPNEIQLDIDTDEQYEVFLKRFNEVNGRFFEMTNTILKSKSGNRHVIITLPTFVSEWQRIALQFMFGSDPIRETLNIYRIFAGEKKPTRLFRPRT